MYYKPEPNIHKYFINTSNYKPFTQRRFGHSFSISTTFIMNKKYKLKLDQKEDMWCGCGEREKRFLLAFKF